MIQAGMSLLRRRGPSKVRLMVKFFLKKRRQNNLNKNFQSKGAKARRTMRRTLKKPLWQAEGPSSARQKPGSREVLNVRIRAPMGEAKVRDSRVAVAMQQHRWMRGKRRAGVLIAKSWVIGKVVRSALW